MLSCLFCCLSSSPPLVANKLYVSMLSTHTTEDELYARFIPFGSISEVVILREKDDAGTSKGCAFVKFLTAEAAQAAILALDKQVRDKVSETDKLNANSPAPATHLRGPQHECSTLAVGAARSVCSLP